MTLHLFLQSFYDARFIIYTYFIRFRDNLKIEWQMKIDGLS